MGVELIDNHPLTSPKTLYAIYHIGLNHIGGANKRFAVHNLAYEFLLIFHSLPEVAVERHGLSR
jgi:hypothetical protein